jgi:DnaJ-class molecular chaperone
MSLKIDDLLLECKKCKGSGELEHPDMSRNQGSYGQSRVVWATPVNCDECKGKGLVPTEVGETLLEFLRLAKSKGLLS